MSSSSLTPFLLTKCAACAAPLETGIKRCSRCKTRYCSAVCQREHWRRRGGHKATCELIASRGGAEANYITEQGAAAFNVAVDASEIPMKGTTCRICKTEKPTEGLVRGCSCDGPAGFVHSSCIVRQAYASNPPGKYSEATWAQWRTCARCHQEYHGAVRHALGWGCWLKYWYTQSVLVVQCAALLELAIGLMEVEKYQRAYEILDMIREMTAHIPEKHFPVLNTFAKIVLKARICRLRCCRKLGTLDGEPIDECRETVSFCETVVGNAHELVHLAALDLGTCLLDENFISEALDYLRERLPLAVRALGDDHAITIELRLRHAQATYGHHFFGHQRFRATLLHSIYLHGHILDRSRELLGDHHPLPAKIDASMQLCFREQLDWTLDDFPADLRRIVIKYI